ncbi:EF-hand domain-containing protein d1 [Plakobranchus ocellatus]|uniref:EF-hand domain-containing protein d1 n=1 Tax=Plakobranchus ocellatus TaxID=259542 RepID=A0AAV4DR25_9GAST|nr:EF-hand domain-containing protein d1 [Plakobranchus ocellatus]
MTTRLKWSVLALFVAIAPVFQTTWADDKPYCVPMTDLSGKRLPSLNVTAFTVEYRVIIQDKQYTMWARESYDFGNNRVRMDILKNGLEQALLIDYTDNTYIFYEYLNEEKSNYSCNVQKLDQVTSDNLDVFGFKPQSQKAGGKAVPHVVSADQILRFAKGFGEMYKGQTIIDGLPVDRWQSCITWDDVGATFTLDYYFTTESFKPRDLLTPRQIPVRAEVMGIVKKGNAKARQIHHVYEYLDFRVFDRLNWDTFSLPDFMICSGERSVWNRGFPIPPDSMSYTVEKVVSTLSNPSDKDAKVDLSTVYYDARRRLVRVDKESYTTIIDFSTGLEYGFDQSGCTIRAIDPARVSWAVKEDGVIKMVDMDEIALMRNMFYFTGYKLFRGVQTLAFAGNVKGYQLEAYLSLDGQTPLGLKVKTVSTDSFITYNIFNFLASSQRSKEHSFDVSKCVKSDNTIQRVITWTPQRQFYNSIESLDVEDLRVKVAEFLGISSLQIVTEDYAFDTVEGTFHWFVSFLGFDSQQSQAKVENQLPIKSLPLIDYTVIQAERGRTLQCTVSLGLYGSSLMIATDIIFSGSSVRLGIESHIEYSYSVSTGKCAKIFEDKETFINAKNEHECGKACVDLKVIPCTMFQYTKATQACQLSWMEKRPELVRTPGCNFHGRMYRFRFRRYTGTVLIARSDSAYREASDDETCAKHCMEEKNFFCESFDYCETEKRCQIYDTHYFSDEATPQKSDQSLRCTHYSRSYSSQFTYSPSRDFHSAEAIDLTIDYTSSCAYMCLTLEGGCAAFSDCSEGREIRCKLLPATKAQTAVFGIDNSSCMTGIPRGNVGIGKIALSAAQSIQTGSDGGSRYTGAEMFGLSVAMALVGVLCAILTVILLQRFNMWEGF